MRWLLLLTLCLMASVGCAKTVAEWKADLEGQHEPYARVLAATALGASGRPEAVAPLIGALADESESVRRAAEQALVELGGTSAGVLVDGLAGQPPHGAASTETSARLLVEIGAAAVPALVSVLDGERTDEPVAVAVAVVLGRIGEPAIQPLIGRLASAQAAAAARGLAEAGPAASAAVEPLVDLLGAGSPSAREAAALALAAIAPGVDRVLEALLAAAADPEPPVARAALSGGVDELLSRLVGPDPEQRSAARRRATELGQAAVPALIVALKGADAERAEAAAEWLGELGPGVLAPALTAVGQRHLDHIERLGLIARRLGEPAFELLLERLEPPPHADRVKAALVLGMLGRDAERAAPRLVALLDASQPDLPAAAAWALSQMVVDDPETLDALLASLEREDAIVRRALMPAAVTGLLHRVAAAGQDAARRVEQLAGLAYEAEPTLRRLAASGDPALAGAARRALTALGLSPR
jgi:HEAT repeat protein